MSLIQYQYCFKKVITVLLITFLPFAAQAARYLAVTNNATVKTDILAQGAARIAVKGDRIQQTISVYRGQDQNAVFTETDDRQGGSIFIVPHTQKSFQLMLRTEKGTYYTLVLVPTAAGPNNKKTNDNTIILVPQRRVKKIKTAKPKTQPMIHKIIRLMRTMAAQKPVAHYALTSLAAKPLAWGKQASIQCLAVYRSHALTGVVLRFKNATHHTLYLLPQNFFGPQVVAVGLLRSKVPPHGQVLVFEVLRHA